VEVLIPPMQVRPFSTVLPTSHSSHCVGSSQEAEADTVPPVRSSFLWFGLQASIVDAYKPFHDVVREHYDFGTSSAILSPVRLWEFLRAISEEKETAESGREEGR
jgi:hypothetical protein